MNEYVIWFYCKCCGMRAVKIIESVSGIEAKKLFTKRYPDLDAETIKGGEYESSTDINTIE